MRVIQQFIEPLRAEKHRSTAASDRSQARIYTAAHPRRGVRAPSHRRCPTQDLIATLMRFRAERGAPQHPPSPYRASSDLWYRHTSNLTMRGRAFPALAIGTKGRELYPFTHNREDA